MYKILIVEDDNTIAERLASHLKKWNYKTVCVRDFKNVIKKKKKNNVKVLLVQPQFPKSSVDLISKEVPGIKIIEFNPLEENIFDNLKKFTDSLE